MGPLHIFIWNHPLSLPRPLGGIPVKTTDLLRNLKFNGEGKVSTFRHVNQFNITCLNLKIIQDSKICWFLTLTLEGWIKDWYMTLLSKSIHYLKQFIEVFITAHENYDYEKLCSELEEIYRNINEPLDDFFQKVMRIYYRFHENDRVRVLP